LDSLNNTLLEVERDLSIRVKQIPHASVTDFDKGRENGEKIKNLILQEVEEVVQHYSQGQDVSKYNKSDYNYHRALSDASELYRIAMQKFQYWEGTIGVFPLNFPSLSMRKVDCKLKGRTWACYRRLAQEGLEEGPGERDRGGQGESRTLVDTAGMCAAVATGVVSNVKDLEGKGFGFIKPENGEQPAAMFPPALCAVALGMRDVYLGFWVLGLVLRLACAVSVLHPFAPEACVSASWHAATCHRPDSARTVT
jgi:hypothetical protein